MELKDKTQIKFYRGLDVIGGTIISVTSDDARIIFDIGTTFSPTLEQKMPNYQVSTMIDYDLIADLGNFYAGKNSPHLKLTHNAVLMSHVHLDHSRLLNYLAPDVPVFVSKKTKQLLKFLDENHDFLLHPDNNDHPIIAKNLREEFFVGEIGVTFYPVDHDADGAVAFVIQTPTAKIAYTGDLRLHGTRTSDTREFIVAAKNCDLLISEAVNYSFSENEKAYYASEDELLNEVSSLIQDNHDQMVTFKTYPANLTRTINFGSAQNNQRITVYDAKTAALIKQITGKDEHYYEISNNFQQKLLDPKFKIPYHCLLREPQKYFFEISDNYQDLLPGSIYLHSDAEPLGDFDPKYQPFLDQLQQKAVNLVLLSCSGHAKKSDLDLIVREIEPKILVPIHSFHPELLENPNGERILPSPGQILSI